MDDSEIKQASMTEKVNLTPDILASQELPKIIMAKPRSGMSVISSIDLAKEVGTLSQININNQPGRSGKCSKVTK